jgi:hypothetical protein
MEIKSEEQKEESKKRKAAGKSTRTYEYLNILPLYESLKTACLQSAGRVALPTHQGHEIRMLLALICATGTHVLFRSKQMKLTHASQARTSRAISRESRGDSCSR